MEQCKRDQGKEIKHMKIVTTMTIAISEGKNIELYCTIMMKKT